MKVSIWQCKNRARFPKNITSLGIMFFQKTNYSHYALEFNSRFYHSSGSGVKSISKEKFLKRYRMVRRIRCTKDINCNDFRIWFFRHIGKKYAFAQLVGLLGKTFKIIKHNPFGRGAKRIICNELVLLFLNKFYNTHIPADHIDCYDLNDTEKLLSDMNL